MKYNCKVIQDLLPLYTDGICSDVSAQMVEEHLKECASCEKIAKELQDDSVEKTLGKECDHVVLSHEKKVSKKMVTAGSITAAVLLIPVIVCLICNLAIGHALDWFFIVLTALLVVASVTLVPMLVVEKKAVYTVLAFTGTLVLLLFTCCFYTHGNWFFVAAAAVVFGLSVCFAPVVIHGLLSDGRWKRKRAWIVVAWDSFWLYLLLAVCGWFVHGNVTYWRVALGISTYSILLVWGWTAVLCSRNCNRWKKAGLLVMLTGVWTGFVTDVVNFLLRDTENGLRYLDLAKGFPLDDPAVMEGEKVKKRIRCCVLILIFSVLVLQQTVVSAAEQILPSGISFDEIGSKMQAFEKKHADTTAGLAVSVFTSKEDVTQYAGYTDMEKKIKTDETSVFEWGSTTKLLVFLSVMQQLEQNNLDLDTDIRTYLPKDFLKNLTFAEPVTMTELMNHTAGFQEEYVGLYEKGITAYPSLKEALYEHEPKQVYKPGTVTAYSNWGVALAAYIVERVSGQEFSSYVREHIFTPLGMNHTAVSVDLSDCPWVQKQWKKLQCYTADGEKVKDCKTPLLLYPAGRAVSTLTDFRMFARAVLTKDKLLLQEKTWELLFTPTDDFGTTQIPKNMHGFWMASYGIPVYGHGGNTMGCSANLLLDVKDGVGVVVMTNQAYEEIYNVQMPELVFGTYDRSAYIKEEMIPKGIYRTARTDRRGPFKWMSLSYKMGEVDDSQLWTASDTDGGEKISYAYGDDIRISTREFVLEIGSVLLWGLTILWAAGSLLVQGAAACIRKIKKKTNFSPFRNWGIAANGMQLLVLVCFIGTVYGVSTYQKWETYAWLFAVIGLLAFFMAVLAVYGMVKRKNHLWTGKKRWFYGNLFFLLVTVLNIGYWNLYQFWN